MVVHWYRQLGQSENERAHNRMRLVINAVGAVTTGIAAVIIVTTKFAEGAWITLLIIPLAIALLRSIKRYYDDLARELRDEGALALKNRTPPIVVVVGASWNRLTEKALVFALSVSPDVYALHLKAIQGPDRQGDDSDLREQWCKEVENPAHAAGLRPPKLLVREAQYRRIDVPLLGVVTELQAEYPDRVVSVLIPEVVKQGWWQYLLHTRRARRIRSALLSFGGERLVLMHIPWHLRHTDHSSSLEPELRSEEDQVREEVRTVTRPAAAAAAD
jgi:hypothetical protein